MLGAGISSVPGVACEPLTQGLSNIEELWTPFIISVYLYVLCDFFFFFFLDYFVSPFSRSMYPFVVFEMAFFENVI